MSNGMIKRVAANRSTAIMSETVDTQPKPKAIRRDSADGHILAQVEKWMAMIREISREQAKS
jgi:hypothetical protein